MLLYIFPGTECTPNGANTDNIHPSASSGVLTSPGFPTSLPRNAFTCVWRLSVPKGQVIKLDIETMALRLKGYKTYCPSTMSFSTNIGSGQYEMAKLVCNDHSFRSYVSDGRKMKILYEQDAIKPGDEPVGFNIGYSAVPLGSYLLCVFCLFIHCCTHSITDHDLWPDYRRCTICRLETQLTNSTDIRSDQLTQDLND